MRPLSEPTSRIVSQNCSRKFMALGRILSHWDEIMGHEFAHKAQPVKLNYRKVGKGAEPSAILEIATTSSYATTLPYQKGLILERINRIFGAQWISDIRFVTVVANQAPEKRRVLKQLEAQEEAYLESLLEPFVDQEMKDKLEKLGKAILTEN